MCPLGNKADLSVTRDLSHWFSGTSSAVPSKAKGDGNAYFERDGRNRLIIMKSDSSCLAKTKQFLNICFNSLSAAQLCCPIAHQRAETESRLLHFLFLSFLPSLLHCSACRHEWHSECSPSNRSSLCRVRKENTP